MAENQYVSGLQSATDPATDGRRLSPVEDFLPAALAGTPSADELSAPDGQESGWRWIEQETGSLYRFRVGGTPTSASAGRDPEEPASTAGGTAAPGSTAASGTTISGPFDGSALAVGGGAGGSSGSGTVGLSTVQVGTSGGLVFNISFDSSVVSAPAGFTAAINYVAQLFASSFSNPITINLDVGWGEIGGQSLSSGALGESETYLNTYSYSQVRSALTAHATSADQKAAVSTLPSTAPTGNGSYSIATAEAKALSLTAASSSLDGYVGFGSGYNYTFDPNNQAISGAYDFIGVAAHEITEVMGRDSYLGEGLGYTALDLFRYSSPGARQLSAGKTAYFSIDGGSTNLDNLNTVSGGDPGDWASSAGNDAFNAFSNSGVANTVGSTDMRELNVLGYNLTSSSSPTGSPTSTPSAPPAPLPQSPTAVQPVTLDTMAAGDFANRGVNDTIWFGTDGTVRIYEVTGGQVTAAPVVAQVGSNWKFAAVGHFFGNAAASDFMLRRSDGAVELYQVQNDQVVGASQVAVIGTEWNVVATGDFYQNGTDDMLMQRSSDGALELYAMQGGQVIGASALATPGSGWTFAGVGNFCRNGTLDYLAEQQGTGALELYQVSNGQVVAAASLGVIGGNNHVVGVADFNNDGTSDFLTQSDTGTLRIYEVQNGQVVAAPTVGQIGTNWQPAGVGNFFGDGESFLMRSGPTVELYHVQNYDVLGASTLASVGSNVQISGAYFNHLV